MEQKTLIYTKWWFWVLMLVGGGIFLLIFKMISKSLTNPQSQPKTYTYTDPETGQTKSVNFAPEPLTDALYYDINEVWGLRDNTPYKNLLGLGDGEFVAVATDWNQRYKKELGETLRQSIRGEKTGFEPNLQEAIEAKFQRLNII